MDNYPYAPHPGQTDTSADGAEKIAPAAAAIREKVITAIADAGLAGTTVVEFCDRYNEDRFGAQPRFSELRKQGRIIDSGLRRKNPSGVNAIVWVAKGQADG